MKDFFQKIIKVLEDNNIEYVIVGGIAAIIRGSARTTSDIDVIIAPQLSTGEKYFEPEFANFFIQIFRKAGFDVPENQLRIAFKEKSNLSLFGNTSIIRLDIKVATSSDEYEVLHTAEIEYISSLKFKIATVEQILYGKILYLGDVSDLKDEELLDFNDTKDFINVYNNAEEIDKFWLERKAKDRNLIKTYRRLLRLSEKYTNF